MKSILRRPTDDKRIAEPKKVTFELEEAVEPMRPREMNQGTAHS